MKSNLIFSSLLVISILLSSCKKEEEEDPTTSTAPKEIILPRVEAIPSEPYVQSNNQNVAPVQNQTINPNSQAPSTAKAGMNPAHGQPGHRCEIAVGAPLNSPAAKPAPSGSAGIKPAIITTGTPTTTTTTIPATAAAPALLNPNPVTTSTAPGMNPPHGEAGHVCSVAVGAALPK